jgi:hypothetical protein
MTGTALRRMGAALLGMVVAAGGCAFKDSGINVGQSDGGDQADDGGFGAGGSGGSLGRDGSADRPSPTGGLGGGPDGSALTLDGPAMGSSDGAPPTSDAPGLALGTACDSDGACDSGFCVDKVCCDTRCGEACHSCSGLTNGAKAGQCKPDVPSTPCGPAVCMGSMQTPAPTCDAMGACLAPPGAACPNSLVCASATACKTKCAAETDCTGGLVCDVATGACHPPGKPNGQACAAAGECSSGFCSDKVCCDVACTGTCRSCVAAQTNKPDGTCGNVNAGVKDARCVREEPSSCGRDGTCDGTGKCRTYPNGTRCATDCCRDSGGPGGGVRVCAFECTNGTCDKTRPTVLDRCGGFQCCCPGAAGGPACTTALGCPGGGCM